MDTNKILVSESLQETIWRLEEVRQGFRSKSDVHAQEALEWILIRQGLPKSYSKLFAPTSQDLSRGARLLTGERIQSNAATRHILGEESLRAAIVWNRRSSSAVKRALQGFNDILEAGGKNGSWCCYICTVAFLRTLVAAKPKKWDRVVERGLNRIEQARTSDGRWHGFPFYYTLLALSEIETSSAKAELKYASKIADRLAKRYPGDDRISRFRMLGLEAALKAV